MSARISKYNLFTNKIWEYYKKHGRHDLPWRLPAQAGKTLDPYRILVSEIMLQQTQVERVIPKYKVFLKAFPTVKKLAAASNTEVLKIWSGLGYNRRALFLKRAAEYIIKTYMGKFPKTIEELEKLPGVGPYTACAVATFSFGASYPFIETNIRSVFLHEFFPKTKRKVSDDELFPYIVRTLPKEKTREWYWALMDYGAHLKRTRPNPSRKSAGHTIQSRFKGSVREARGLILKRLPEVRKVLLKAHPKASIALQSLLKEGMLVETKSGRVTIKE